MEFDEKFFAIDLISTTLDTINPNHIRRECESKLDVLVTTIDVINYLEYSNREPVKRDFSLSSKEIFEHEE